MITTWFQSDSAYRLMQACDHDMRPVRVRTAHCSCLIAVMGPWWCRRGIVQGGVEIDDSVPCTAYDVQQEVQQLLEQVREAGKKAGCVYVEIRNFNDYSAYHDSFTAAGWTYKPHWDAQLVPDYLREQMHESKRRAISKAIAEGQIWREAKSEAEVRAFYIRLRTLYRVKVHRPLPNWSFFLTAWRQGIKVLVVTDRNDVVIGGVLMPIQGKVAYEWYICGGVMSTWAMMEYAHSNGLTLIDLMGAGEPGVPYGVRDFKVQMGAELKAFGRYLWVNKPWVYKLGKFVIGK